MVETWRMNGCKERYLTNLTLFITKREIKR